MAGIDSTRDRIIAAARDEFARYGIAGARVDRIAKAARTSKERVYAHFRSKEMLYKHVAATELAAAADAVHLDPSDLPAYAGQLFDYFTAHPDRYRFVAWGRLELVPEPAQEPAQGPPQEPAQRPAQGPAQEPAQGPAQAPVQEPAQAPQGPAQKPAQEPAEGSSGERAEEPAEDADGDSPGPYRDAILGKIELIRRAQEAGDIDPTWDPVDVMAVISQIAHTWLDQAVLVAVARHTAADPTPSARRAAVIRAVTALFPPKPRSQRDS